MRYKGLTTALLLLIVLCLTSCRASKEVRTRVEQQIVEIEAKRADSVKENVMVAVFDTIRETTTITVLTTTEGDTLRVEKVVERDDSKLRVISSEVMVKSEAVEATSDTLIVRDSVAVVTAPVAGGDGTAKRNVGTILWWIFAIICALGGLVYMIKKK